MFKNHAAIGVGLAMLVLSQTAQAQVHVHQQMMRQQMAQQQWLMMQQRQRQLLLQQQAMQQQIRLAQQMQMRQIQMMMQQTPQVLLVPVPVPMTIPAAGNGQATEIRWTGSENLQGYGPLEFRFAPNGRVTMIDADGAHPGTFTQKGQNVALRFHNGTVIYAGAIAGNTMSGTARNGKSNWNFSVSR